MVFVSDFVFLGRRARRTQQFCMQAADVCAVVNFLWSNVLAVLEEEEAGSDEGVGAFVVVDFRCVRLQAHLSHVNFVF